MTKILFGTLAFLILAFIIIAMYCAIVVSGRSDENESNGDNSEVDDDERFWKKQICPKSQVGKWGYDLDEHLEICP